MLVTNYYAIDLESWAHSKFGAMAQFTSEQRKQADRGATLWQAQQLLKALQSTDARLTWFITSEIFDWHPGLIEAIHNAGHEIAFHTHVHRTLRTAADLSMELESASRFLQEWKPKGFRAPAFAMPTLAYELLNCAGFNYSSSSFGATEHPTRISALMEIPVSTYSFRAASNEHRRESNPMSVRLWMDGVPFGSAYFLGLFGSGMVSRFLDRRQRRGLPSNLFIHNWQLFAHCTRSIRHQYVQALLNPLYLPYTRIVLKDFVHLIRRYRFVRLDEHPSLGHASDPNPLKQIASIGRF